MLLLQMPSEHLQLILATKDCVGQCRKDRGLLAGQQSMGEGKMEVVVVEA